ncbi:3',5'-cyclic AMP phosphodiesterase CpdA [Clostridium cavendishii DSM 21758]|uniref:3',5'-cyclic AMP phosphodiesterase CpdA n=1 Tax=Clostridium cavendishii DSM 21758 TaxID=1121302 RepID=A0A1M6PAJ2_9CLOT|nr:metallophosphoesterase [Clostridium cavendishii]SHK04963.1 3',5'-cyclic AMP phosphodiesterase CpdA [Clostridium cavendishii DSM 21758]
MKKVSFKLMFMIFILIMGIVLIGCNKTLSKKDEAKAEATSVKVIKEADVKKDEDSGLSFSVLGDVHEDVNNFNEAVDDLYNIDNKQDALILNGDVVGQGLDEQYVSMNKAIEANKSKLPKTIIKNIGNHEFFDYRKDRNTQDDVNEFIKRYLDFSGEDRVYHDKWIEGYHFISLGSESGNTKELGSVKAYLSKEQLKWFEETIKEKYEKGKPIFIFLHQHINDSIKGWNGSDQREKVKKILSKYPEAIIFTSHTHLPLEKINLSLNNPYTMVHTGAVQYSLVIDNNGKITRPSYNEGIYVSVKQNKVTIKGRRFKEHRWIFSKDIEYKK